MLRAIGLKQEDIMGSLRISISEENTMDEISSLVNHIEVCLQELRSKKD